MRKMSSIKKFGFILLPLIIVIIIASWPQGQHQERSIPLITTGVNGFINSTMYVVDGMVVVGNKNITLPALRPWGANNGLTIELSDKYDLPFFLLQGTSLGEPVGFSSQLNYAGQYISVIVGEVSRPIEAYLSFSFKIQGQHNEYLVVLSFGSVPQEGWVDGNYYARIGEFSSKLIDLKELFRFKLDNYLRVVEFNIIVAKNSTVLVEFRLDLGKITENLPSTVPESSWVFGDVAHSGRIISSKITIHSFFSFFYRLKVEFLKPEIDYKVNSDQWDLLAIEENGGYLLAVVERKMDINELTPASIRNIDVVASLISFQRIDWLFFLLFAFIIVSLSIGSLLEKYLDPM